MKLTIMVVTSSAMSFVLGLWAAPVGSLQLRDGGYVKNVTLDGGQINATSGHQAYVVNSEFNYPNLRWKLYKLIVAR